MNRIEIKHTGPLKGEITTPPDKSISHRSVMFASLATGKSRVENFLTAEDPMSTLDAFRQMGVNIETNKQQCTVTINSDGLRALKPPSIDIDCGNSGTTMRLMSGVLAGQDFPSVLTGDDSLRLRPMQRIITPLSEMGALINSASGKPPLKITGTSLHPIDYVSPVASAQVKSAIMLAGLYCSGTTTVTEPERSRDHTERMLKASGATITVEGLKVSIEGASRLEPFEITVPGDISSAAFFMAAALIVPGSEILIKNTGINPTRTGIIDIIRQMGGTLRLENQREVSGEPVADIYVKYSLLKGANIGGDVVVKAIDEFPIVCVLAAMAEGTTTIRGAQELRVKESDRISTMTMELRKMGVMIEELSDGMIIEGRDSLLPALAESHGDHRVAMSLAIAGLTVKDATIINNTGCVNTSFPGFTGLISSLQGEK